MLFRIVVAFAFFVFSLKAAEDGMKNFAEISKKCEEENGLTNGEIQQINASKPIETDDLNVKCYFRCLLLELNLVGNVEIHVGFEIPPPIPRKLAVLHENKESFQPDYCCRQMDSNGNLILEGVANIKPEYRKYIVECSNTAGVESCDKALNFENCVWAKKMADGTNS